MYDDFFSWLRHFFMNKSKNIFDFYLEERLFMTLEQIVYFVSIYKEGSITKASKQLFVSQSTVSTAIQRLEDEFNLLLFKRTKKGVIPTVHANYLIDHFETMLYQLNMIQDYVASNGEQVIYTLKLNSIPAFENFFLPEFISSIVGEMPNLRVTLTERDNTTSIREIVNGDVDLAIISYTNIESDSFEEMVSRKNLRMEQLYKCSMSYYVRSEHPLLKYKKISENNLANYTLLTNERLIEVKKESINFKKVIIEKNIRHMQAMLCSNDFVAILPDFLPERDIYINTGKIKPLSQLKLQATVFFGIIYRSEKELLPTEKKFIELLKANLFELKQI